MINEYIELHVSDHILFFLIGILVPIMTLYRGKPDFSQLNFELKDKIRLYYSNSAVQWFGVILILLLWLFHSRPLSSLGLQLGTYGSVVYILVGLMVSLYFFDLLFKLYSKEKRKETFDKVSDNLAFLPDSWDSFKHFIFVAFTAGVCEEIVYRGFLINYTLGLFGSNEIGHYSAILLPAVIFGSMHIYQGHGSTLKIILGGILFGLIYYYSGSLILPMIIHFLIDLISSFLIMNVVKENTVVPESRTQDSDEKVIID